MTNRPFHYAPIRACLRGPGSDSRTIAVLCVPLHGDPVLARMDLPPVPDAALIREGCDALFAEAVRAAAGRAERPRALIDWWVGRAACTADGVYLDMPMSGAGGDPQAEADAILARRIAG
ncbi:hypothetical protein LBMAG42_45490 [Deltaproteobacteria bacterium]|nr:hypothetical protein LBMAG42_45490 [Deltaproteobacteria bacterium]